MELVEQVAKAMFEWQVSENDKAHGLVFDGPRSQVRTMKYRELAKIAFQVSQESIGEIIGGAGNQRIPYWKSHTAPPIGTKLYAYPTAQEWKTMESAPRDGTSVLISSPKGIEVVVFDDVSNTWYSGSSYHRHPTHWMTILAPPKRDTDETRS